MPGNYAVLRRLAFPYGQVVLSGKAGPAAGCAGIVGSLQDLDVSTAAKLGLERLTVRK